MSRSSPWAKAPDRGVALKMIDSPTPKLKLDETTKSPLFKPSMISDADVRRKVPSSGYGKVRVEAKKKPDLPTHEDKEAATATFKPDLKYGKKQRESAQSNGYGKMVPETKVAPKGDAPTFKPNLDLGPLSRKMKNQAASSGYGQVIAESPNVKKEAMHQNSVAGTFTPDLNQFGEHASKIRSKAPSQTYLQERPKTAPAKNSIVTILRHTLAADKGRDEPIPENKDIGPGFELPRSTMDLTAPSHKDLVAGTFPPVEPVAETRASIAIKSSAQSHGYGTSYEPPHVPFQAKPSEQVMSFGISSTTYVDTPDKLPKFDPSSTHLKSLERAATSGYGTAEYAPTVGEKAYVDSVPLFKFSLNNPPPPSVELMSPVPKKSIEVQSSGYGVTSPAVGEKKQVAYYSPKPRTVAAVDNQINSGASDGGDEDGAQVTMMPLDESDVDDVIDEY